MSTSSWDTSSGLPDEFRLVVGEAWFGENEQSERPDPDKLFLHLAGDMTEEGEDEIEEDYVLRFSIGKGWEIEDEGAEVAHASGKNRFNRNSGIGKVIDGLKALGADTLEALAERGDTYQAATYEGLTIDFERRVVSTFKDDDGNMRDWELPIPTAVDFPKPKKAKGGKKGKGGSKKASKGKGKPDSAAADKLYKKLQKFAGDYEDHADFVEEALEEFDNIEDYPELHAEFLDDESDLWLES